MALLRGKLLAGALFAGALFGVVQQVEQVEQQTGGGHWKHLFRAIQSAETPELKLRSASRLKVEFPETYDIRQGAETPVIRVGGRTAWAEIVPITGTLAESVNCAAESRIHVGHPKCAGKAIFLHGAITATGTVETPIAASIAPDLGATAKSYYTYAYPETVQNPTEEMLLELFR